MEASEQFRIVLHTSRWLYHTPCPWKHGCRHQFHSDGTKNNNFINNFRFWGNGCLVIVPISVNRVKFECRMVIKVHRNVFSCQIVQYEPDSIHLVKQFVTSAVPWRPSWIFFVRASCGPRKSRRKLLWVSVGPRLPSCKFSETCPQTPIRTYSDKFLSSYNVLGRDQEKNFWTV